MSPSVLSEKLLRLSASAKDQAGASAHLTTNARAPFPQGSAADGTTRHENTTPRDHRRRVARDVTPSTLCCVCADGAQASGLTTWFGQGAKRAAFFFLRPANGLDLSCRGHRKSKQRKSGIFLWGFFDSHAMKQLREIRPSLI